MLNDNEHIEPLGRGFAIIVSDIHKFSTDTILLANFAKPKKHETAADLGTGCGTIPLIWARDSLPKHTVGVEIQKDACDMFKRSIAINDMSDKIEAVNSDMRALSAAEYAGKFDLVVCNPPYKQSGTGIVNPEIGKATARHEQDITIDEIVSKAAMLIRFGGRLCMCQRPERLCDVIEAMRKAQIEPKRLRLVQQRQSKAPKLFLIEGKRGAAEGGMLAEPALFIENETGDFSDEMKEIYGIYKSYKYAATEQKDF